MTSEPVFIHSLFRAGSTYLFSLFRRSKAGFTCFQEPLHELSYYSKKNKELLLSEGESKMAFLRHPKLDSPYYQELYQAADTCLDFLSAESIYDGYFALGDVDFGIGFWRSLIDWAPARPVIQECRTSCRIGAIKSAVGGFHIYLLRNAPDQWWSYKVDRYFDITNQLVLNSPYHPGVIARLRKTIGFKTCHHDDFKSRQQWFMENPLSPEHSYLVFYVLWLLGLSQGVRHGDLVLNVDRLSCSRAYQEQVTDILSHNGITDIDFSGCNVPRAAYLSRDRAFFDSIEKRAEELFLEAGISPATMDGLLAVKNKNEFEDRKQSVEKAEAPSIYEDAQRARCLVLAKEREMVERCTHFQETMAFLEQRALDAEQHLKQSEASAQQAQTALEAIYTSRSWRLTGPVRFFSSMVQRVLKTIQSGPGRMALPLKGHMRSSVAFWAGFVQGRPLLYTLVVKVVSRFPSLEARLRSAANNGTFSLHRPGAGGAADSLPYGVAHLSYWTKKNFHDLEKAMVKQKESKN